MDFGKYVNHKSRRDAPFADEEFPEELKKRIMEAKTHGEVSLIFTEKARHTRATRQKEWAEEERRLRDLFKKDALEEVGLTGHPKANKAFEMAWDRGDGYREVMVELEELAELLLDEV